MAEGDYKKLVKESLAEFNEGWKLYIGIIVIFSFLPQLINVIIDISVYGPALFEKDVAFTTVDIVFLPLIMILSIFSSLAVISAIRNSEATFSEATGAGLKRLLHGILLTIIMTFGLIFLFLLLIIPGIYFSIKWAFAYFALMDEKTGPLAALKQSSAVVKGNWWRVVGYSMLFTLCIYIVSMLIMLILGLLMIPVAFVSEYLVFALVAVLGAFIYSYLSVMLIIFMEKFYQLLKQEQGGAEAPNNAEEPQPV